MTSDVLHIGAGAGFSGDRTDAAGPVVATLAAHGGPAALIFETLAERTLALAQIARRTDPEAGYDPRIDQFVGPILKTCVARAIPIVGNFGAANPRSAARRLRALAHEQGLARLRIGVVEGDDLSDARGREILRDCLSGTDAARAIVSANVYQGAHAIAMALRAGAQVVVAGRVADPSLAVGPAMAHYGWSETDWTPLGRATMAGHLLECGAQASGGYFADPGYKDVPDLHAVGFPIAAIAPDGSFTLTKAAGTGGLVDARTVKEQLLYEVHDPAAYITPDVVADISDAEVEEVGTDRVAIAGVRGHPRTETLKVNVCFDGGWFGEAEISYAGPNAEARARLAGDVIRKRIGAALRLRLDLIGVLSVFGDDDGHALGALEPGNAREVRLRVAATHADRVSVQRLLDEVTALLTCGPAGGGGVRANLRSRLATVACLVPRDRVPARFEILE